MLKKRTRMMDIFDTSIYILYMSFMVWGFGMLLTCLDTVGQLDRKLTVCERKNSRCEETKGSMLTYFRHATIERKKAIHPNNPCTLTKRLIKYASLAEAKLLLDRPLMFSKRELKKKGYSLYKIRQNYLAAEKIFCRAKYALHYHLNMVYKNERCAELVGGSPKQVRIHYKNIVGDIMNTRCVRTWTR